MRVLILTVLMWSFTSHDGSAQKLTYSWNPSGMLIVGVGGGLTKYFGEFTDQNWALGVDLHAKYFVVPEIAFQLNGGMGTYAYNRRLKDEFGYTYVRQFYRDPKLAGLSGYPDDAKAFDDLINDPRMRDQVLEEDKLWWLEGRALINFFPKEQVNPYFSVGVGIMSFTNNNAGSDVLNVTFDNKPFQVDVGEGDEYRVVRMNSNLSSSASSATVIPIGFGLDYIINEQLSINADLTYRFVLGEGSDMMDGFGAPVQENFNRAGRVDRVKSMESADSWATIMIGVQGYLLGRHDHDDDGLSDSYEASIGTDPLNPDTDGDGLFDGLEYETYGTDPLKTDTDEDRLTDAEEIAKGTDPKNADTDGDGLIDGDEFSHGTDPFEKDTDADGLSDGDEVHVYHSDPLKIDSDVDGLEDKAEVEQYKTDPRSPDTDGDGLDDALEIGMATSAILADSDGDGLNDGDEVNIYKTDPMKADTDGDGLSDGAEVAAGTNLHGSDSDNDGIPDGRDKCPDQPETVNDYLDDDGCADGEPLTRAPLVPGQVHPLVGVTFESGTSTLTAEGETALRPLYQTMSDNPRVTVELGGYTDDRGRAAANRTLSEKRAEQVKAAMVTLGIDGKRIETRGYGEKNPVASNGSKTGRTKNRRIEVKILSVN